MRPGWGIVVVIALVSGCRREPESTAVVEFWALGREGEIVQRMIPAFEREHPEIRLHVQQIPWSAAHEKLLTAYVGEAMPDVFQVGNTWIPEFVALGAIDPLDDRIARSRALSLDDYFGGIADANVIDGSTYGLPWYVDTRLVFYRSDLLEAAGYRSPPQSWSAWTDAMVRVKRAGPSDFAILMPVNEWQPLVIFALQLDARLLRENDTHGNFRSPEFREAFVFYVDLFRRGLAPLASQAQIANLYQEFARGAFAFYVSGPWNIGEFRERLPARVRWSTAPLPGPDDGRYPGVSLAGGASLAIFRGSERKQAAWEWLEFLSEPAQEIELYRLTGDLPARKSAWTSEGPAGNQQARAFETQLEHVRSTPKIPEWERIATLITRYSEAAIRGRLTVDEALVALDQDVDDLLEKRRWLIERRERSAS